MLPFLNKPKQVASAVYRKRSGAHLEHSYENEEPKEAKPLHEAMVHLMSAMKDNDVERMADAFEQAFQACEAAPHYEGPHKE